MSIASAQNSLSMRPNPMKARRGRPALRDHHRTRRAFPPDRGHRGRAGCSALALGAVQGIMGAALARADALSVNGHEERLLCIRRAAAIAWVTRPSPIGDRTG